MPTLSDARIGQIAVACTDVARAKTFYRDTLGLRHLFDAGPTLSFFDCGGVRLMLSTGENTDLPRMSSMVYYFVSNIDAVCADLRAKGVVFPEEPHMIAKLPDHDLWLAAFADSEGNLLGIMEERRG
ncbi:MAG TPA: VOC family protein [Gemmatimonadaceae bacterium]|jgi:methylmalonyl-CoA/ethylmalonyl-CoA epimerase